MTQKYSPPRIEILKEKKLIGMGQKMSLAEDATFQLFSHFMPRKKEIEQAINTDVFDLKIYPHDYFLSFNPSTYFTKWALVEVSDFESIPNGMDTFILTSGSYAVFTHRGLMSDNSIFQYIYAQWLPHSNYEIDDRPHFDILGEKTKRNDPNSEQEIWIPIKEK